MENNDFLNRGISVNDASAASLNQAAKWAKLLAILGFIGAVFMAFAGIFAGAIIGRMGGGTPGLEAFEAVGGVGVTIFYIIFAGIVFIVSLMLYRFANHTQAALASADSIALSRAFSSLNNFLKIQGIIALVYIGIVVLLSLIHI